MTTLKYMFLILSNLSNFITVLKYPFYCHRRMFGYSLGCHRVSYPASLFHTICQPQINHSKRRQAHYIISEISDFDMTDILPEGILNIRHHLLCNEFSIFCVILHQNFHNKDYMIHEHGNRRIVILIKLSSLAAPKVVIFATFGEASDKKKKSVTFPFQWVRMKYTVCAVSSSSSRFFTFVEFGLTIDTSYLSHILTAPCCVTWWICTLAFMYYDMEKVKI